DQTSIVCATLGHIGECGCRVPILSEGEGEREREGERGVWMLGCISEGVAGHSEACGVMSALPLRVQRYPVLSHPLPNKAIPCEERSFDFSDNDTPAVAFLSPTEVLCAVAGSE
ncbi:hypothetical protein KIPB_013513, partial [Kipferlia bialata]